MTPQKTKSENGTVMEVGLETPPSFAPLGKMIVAAIPILCVHDSQQQNSATAN
jgi:hypothetical protein